MMSAGWTASSRVRATVVWGTASWSFSARRCGTVVDYDGGGELGFFGEVLHHALCGGGGRVSVLNIEEEFLQDTSIERRCEGRELLE